MEYQETINPKIFVATNNELDSINQIDCQVGNGDCKPFMNNVISTPTSGAKAKRKARSTRRRLNAMLSNASLHFSDTDSEGELSVPRNASPNHNTKTILKPVESNLLHPVISVTPDVSDDSSYVGGERRSSFIENLTDVDEIYTSEPENNNVSEQKSIKKESLAVADNLLQGETDLEDVSNDEDETVQPPIFVKPRSDIFCDFNGETITTKEGDGPFSVEIRNQMSIDESSKVVTDTPDIVVMPTTDSEDMEASDEDDEVEGACAQREDFIDLDTLAASQIVMKNIDKMEQLLSVKDPEDGISDCHTDVEDIE